MSLPRCAAYHSGLFSNWSFKNTTSAPLYTGDLKHVQTQNPASLRWNRTRYFHPDEKAFLPPRSCLDSALYLVYLDTKRQRRHFNWFMQMTGLLHVHLTLLQYLINVAVCFGHKCFWEFIAINPPPKNSAISGGRTWLQGYMCTYELLITGDLHLIDSSAPSKGKRGHLWY